MFILNKDTNRIEKIENKTFHEFGFKERDHLQEWIAYYPECFELEEILGFKLPNSAYVHDRWWMNDVYHSQAQG